MSRYRCALYVFCLNHSVPRSIRRAGHHAEHRASRRSSAVYLKDSCTKCDVFADFMCRSHFLVAFLFVGTDFNCFLKSIRRSIPMTVAVKLTSTRRCMTCSFFVTFFMYLSRERSGCERRGHCAAQWEVRRDSSAFPSALHSWSYFGSHSARAHSNFEFYGWNQLWMCDDYILLPVEGARGPPASGYLGREARWKESPRNVGMNGLWNINYYRGAHSGQIRSCMRINLAPNCTSAPLYRQQKNRAVLFFSWSRSTQWTARISLVIKFV